MEGRWTIGRMRMGVGWNARMGGPIPDVLPVPVVPVDDAAVERAALALYEEDHGEELPPGYALPPRFRETAATVLRAAGKTS